MKYEIDYEVVPFIDAPYNKLIRYNYDWWIKIDEMTLRKAKDRTWLRMPENDTLMIVLWKHNI